MEDIQSQESDVPLPLISIITVVYNSADVLEKTINSVVNFPYPNKEYIIVDGGSDDGTLDIIHDYHSQISRWISEKDRGLYDAMNKALQMAKGEYVWFLNAGDEAVASTDLKEVFKHHPDPDIIYSDTIVIDKEGIELGMLSQLSHNNAPTNLTWKKMNRGMVVSHQSFIVKKSIAPPFDLSYKFSSDIDWVIKCLKNAREDHIVKINKPLSKFLKGGLSRQYLKKAMVERYFILKKHFGWFRNLFNHIYMLFRYLTFSRKSKMYL